MCIYGGLYGLLWFSLVIYGLYALYSIFVISLVVSVIFGYMVFLLLPYALYLRLPKATVKVIRDTKCTEPSSNPLANRYNQLITRPIQYKQKHELAPGYTRYRV